MKIDNSTDRNKTCGTSISGKSLVYKYCSKIILIELFVSSAQFVSVQFKTIMLCYCILILGKDVWIGGKNVRYEYKWILSSGYGRMNFTNWAPNEPVLYPRHKTYICVQIWQSSSYQWDDFDCGYRQPFVCKNNL